MNSIAVMQPYFFPYIGYFQLIKAADQFVFYDDVDFITGGWINRNKILIQGQAKYLTVPCKKASQNKKINEISHALGPRKIKKLLKKIKFSYAKAPYFDEVFSMIEHVLKSKKHLISELAIASVKETAAYLQLNTKFNKSSECYNNVELSAADRLIDICKMEKADTYINPINGMELYDKDYFKEQEVDLYFLESNKITYEQFDESFVPRLSIIDVMMFNSKEKINDMLNQYRLV